MNAPKLLTAVLTAIVFIPIICVAADETKKPPAVATKPAPAANDAKAQSGSDKLDLKQLEDKYWAAKDTDFAVVQNRTYSKEKRFFFNLGGGFLMNDPYSTGKQMNLSLGYYFNERWGLEVSNEKGTLTDNPATQYFYTTYGVYPNYNKFNNYTSMNLLWVPLYAKMSALDRAIWYFDLQLALGAGQMSYDQQVQLATAGPAVNKTGLGYNFDVTAQVFFSKNFAFRLDLKNKFTNQELLKWSNKTSQGTVGQQDTTLMLGLTWFINK